MKRVTVNQSSSPGAASRRIADTALMIIWEAGMDGRCTYLNPGAMQGLDSPAEASVAEWAKCLHPEDLPKAVRIIREARAKLTEYWLEYRILRSDGTVRWIMSAAAPRFNEDGSPRGYVGTLLDITDIQEARASLMRSGIEHRLLTHHAGDMISHSDADNRYVYASPSHRDILGYDPLELIGTNVYDYIHPDDLKPDSARPSSAGESGRPGLNTIRFRHKDGHWVWLGATTRTVRDPHTGRKLGIVSIARDITAQIEAERELTRREERFRSLTSLSSDWYWETDAQLRFTFISEGFQARMGVPPQHLLGTTFHTTAENEQEPGFMALVEHIAHRRAFRDLAYTVKSLLHPGVVRHIRVSGEPVSEQGAFLGYRGVAHDVTREMKATRALERLATRDTLTELPNRAALDSRLAQRLAERRDAPQAVFFLDLDDFKEVNDSLGHAAGDLLLKQIAARLRASVRSDDIVARLGGDEFVIVAECRHCAESAAEIANALCAAISAPVMIEGHEVKTGTSIGISLYPQDGGTSATLLQNADNALYRAKAAGGKTYRFYTAEMGMASMLRLKLQAAMRRALERNEFEIHYQPRVHLKTLRMTGMEALLHWTHPEMGDVLPADFIPLAEQSGFIDEIGQWVLQHATRQTREWQLRYGHALRVSVNLSPRQLRNRKLADMVEDALRSSGLPASLLELELTETGLMDDPVLAAAILRQLKEAGVFLSVDDFGTGYSSLSYLASFPLDGVKLDRSFLLRQRPGHVSQRKLAKAIIDLGHSLNLSVTAEGVETPQHLSFLRKTPCDEVQGYCISRPLPPAQFERLLRNESLVLQPLRSSRKRSDACANHFQPESTPD